MTGTGRRTKKHTGQLQKGRVNICGQQEVHCLEEDDVWPHGGAAPVEALLLLAAPPSAQ